MFGLKALLLSRASQHAPTIVQRHINVSLSSFFSAAVQKEVEGKTMLDGMSIVMSVICFCSDALICKGYNNSISV